MENRQREILNLIIKEYIKTAEPVGSQILVEKYKLEFSPATVRAEMMELSEKGYLRQPHTSAGRVPTDKDYRFFVDRLSEDDQPDNASEEFLEAIEKFSREGSGFPKVIRDTARTISFISSGVGLCGFWEEDDFFSAGLPNLLKQPEFIGDSDFPKSLEVFDHLDQEIKNIFNEIEKEVQVFIGKESGGRKFDEFSLVVSKCENRQKQNGVVGVMGPKRMDYQKNIRLVSCAQKMLKDL
jgi:heat-inducible transcriptional repressor